MSEWNDAIELAAQLCEKLGREVGKDPDAVGVIHSKRAYVCAAANIRDLKKSKPEKRPAVGRIVQVMVRHYEEAGLHVRPAIITRVGPVRVEDPDVPGLVGLQLFVAPEDIGKLMPSIRARENTLEAHFSPAGGEWKENTWRWPEHV